MNVRTLMKTLEYIGEATGKRQNYYVFESDRRYLLLTFSKRKHNSGNFTVVDRESVIYLRKLLSGKTGITVNSIFDICKKPQFFKNKFDVLSNMYVLCARKDAIVDRRHKDVQLYFNVK
jgi:hypothetical protein